MRISTSALLTSLLLSPSALAQEPAQAGPSPSEPEAVAGTEAQPTAEAQPATEQPTAEAQPATEQPTAETQPAAEQPPAEAAAAPPPVAAAAAAPAAAAPVAQPTAGAQPPASGYGPAEDSPPADMGLVPAEPAPVSNDVIVGLFWDIGVPVGSMADFVGNATVRGFEIDVRYYAFGDFGFGGSLGWLTFAQKDVESTVFNNETQTGEPTVTTVTGAQVHEISTTPLLAKLFYARRSMKPLIPYAGLGIGGSYSTYRVDAGIYRSVDESWQWSVVPEIGAEFPTPVGSALLAARFNYTFESGDAPEQLYFNFGIGWGFF